MAAKRTPKPKVKPQMSGKADAEGLIRRGSGGRFVSSKELKVDLRAASEPAVVVADTVKVKAATVVVSGKQAEPLGVALSKPRPPTLAERMLAWFRKPEKDLDKDELVAQMAAVKAGVMHELEVIGAKKGIALKGSPFSSVVLPVRTRKPYGRWALLAMVVLGIVLTMVWVGSRKDTPDAVLAQLGRALTTQDAEAFATYVDMQAVATDIVNQMFGLPADDLLATHAALLMKPGMVGELQRDMLAAVAGAKVPADTLPLRLKALLGGPALSVGRAHISMQDARMAVAEVPLVRKDLGLTLPLQVVMERREAGWVVTNVPNFTGVVSTVLQAEQMQALRRAAAAAEAQAEALQVRDYVAAPMRVENLVKPVTEGDVLKVAAKVENSGGEPLARSLMKLEFGDAAQRPLLTMYLPVQGAFAAGEQRELAWQVPVDATDARARDVARLPLEAMSVTATVVMP